MKKKAELLTLKLDAKRMYIYEGKTGIEISQLTGISQNSISKWVQDNNWKADRTRILQTTLKGYNNIEGGKIFEDFKSYLNITKPDLLNEVAPEIDKFLNLVS